MQSSPTKVSSPQKDLELVSPAVRSDLHQFLDHTANEYERLRQLRTKTENTNVVVNENELDSVVRKFEESIYREKARVDSGLLQLTSTFTRLVHETRNKAFKHLDDQLHNFRDNIQFLRDQLAQYRHEHPTVPEFDRRELENRLKQTPEARKTELIDEKLGEIQRSKRAYETNYRTKRHLNNLVDKLRNAPTALQQRNDESYAELNRRFEESLRIIVDEYRPRGLKLFRQKIGPTSHLEVNHRNYFRADVVPTIHYFEPQTKNLVITTIPGAVQSGHHHLAKKKVELDIEFNIPAYHGSIVTPEGRVFLIGGIDDTSDGKSNARTYEFDPKNSSLVRKSNMTEARFGFAITYCKGKIYVFGGIGQNGPLKSCEVYDINANRWSSIPDMSEASVHASVCTFKDRYIYKFGGFSGDQAQSRSIKRYCIQDRTWSSVNVVNELLFPLSACAQINSNEIFVFGGLNEHKKGTNRSFVLTVDIEGNINKTEVTEAVVSLGHADLPIGDGFWNPQTLVNNNNLYVLQNVTNQGNVTGRRLLEYKNGTWDLLNA